MALGYLLDPTIQIQDDNGIPAAGAKIYIYEAGTTNPATTYRDFENHANTFPVLTDTLGNCTVIAYDGEYFDLVVNKSDDTLLFSKKNISVNAGAGAVQTDVSVSAGYGIDVTYTPQYKRYTVGIDNDIFPSGGLFTYEPGRNIVFSASGSTRTVNLTNDVTIGNAKMNITGFKYNDTQVNDKVKVGFSDMESSGFKVTDTSGNQAIMDTSDVKVYNNGTWYSLTAAMTGSPLSAGRNVEINSNVIDVTGPNFYYGDNVTPTGASAVNHGNMVIGENNYAGPVSAIGVNIIGSDNSAVSASGIFLIGDGLSANSQIAKFGYSDKAFEVEPDGDASFYNSDNSTRTYLKDLSTVTYVNSAISSNSATLDNMKLDKYSASNPNFDELSAFGFYSIANAQSPGGSAHSPENGRQGMITYGADNYRVQIAAGGKIYYRQKDNNSNTWTDWKTVYNPNLNVGSSAQPVYYVSGSPSACGFKIIRGSVVADADAIFFV